MKWVRVGSWTQQSRHHSSWSAYLPFFVVTEMFAVMSFVGFFQVKSNARSLFRYLWRFGDIFEQNWQLPTFEIQYLISVVSQDVSVFFCDGLFWSEMNKRSSASLLAVRSRQYEARFKSRSRSKTGSPRRKKVSHSRSRPAGSIGGEGYQVAKGRKGLERSFYLIFMCLFVFFFFLGGGGGVVSSKFE